MDEVEIPHYLDSQPQIFFWELDEFAPVIFFMGIGIATDTLTAWIPIMAIFTYVFQRFKISQMEGILTHLVYWYGVLPLNMRFKNGMSREFIS
jgi:conjugal transfer pilus assembly protein TraL